MRVYLATVILLLLATAAVTHGVERCFRPAEIPTCATPAVAPTCQPVIEGTQASNSALCWQCHPHRYEAWMAVYWRRS